MTDSVRVRGENVSAAEVEEVARKHPAIEDCVMIGVAADVGEAAIKLFVKPKAGERASPAGALRLARAPSRALPAASLHRHRRGVRAHAEPAHHETQIVEADR